ATLLDEDDLFVGSFVSQDDADERSAPIPGAVASAAPAASASPAPGASAAPVASASPAAVKPAPLPLTNRVPEDSPVRDDAAAGDYYVIVSGSGSLTQGLEQALRGSTIEVAVDEQGAKQKVRLVTTFLLPLMILANLFAMLFTLGKGGSSAIGDVINFGSIGKGKAKKNASYVTFEDVGGADEAVTELREVRDYLTDPAKYEALGAAPPKGVLLFGPPGTGKTLLAKAVAGEAGVPFFSVAGAQFVEALVGVGAARVRDLFERVRAAAPAIVFIDELDAAGRKRGTGGGGGGSDEREQTLNQLLVEMDGFEVSAGIVVIGATNRPDILDPALMRPGRFDRHITIERPEQEGRERILRIHAKGKPMAPSVDFAFLAERTPGFTGADLANVVNEAALLAIRQGKALVEPAELEEAIMRILTGPKRRGRLMSTDERRRAAIHESGHVVVAAAAGRVADVERVSILSRGKQIATTTLQSDADASLLSQTALRGQLVTLLGGIAAENLVFGEMSTGGEQDLEQATDLARDMVARYGMSPILGPVRLLGKASEAFLGNDIPLADVSPETRATLDSEIRRFIAEAQDEAMDLLARHRATLDGLAERLEHEETLEGEELQEVLAPIEREMSREKISPNGRAVRRTTTVRSTGSRRAPAKTASRR
ncbi:MAG TPA: ATP-dependent zinc metalloprotease FtsH, partial [Mycobacteriales bacterium]|nr:ATP-dependent zinc metalloprotease FtsH [Mycobacteriales bacterium]